MVLKRSLSFALLIEDAEFSFSRTCTCTCTYTKKKERDHAFRNAS